MTDTMTEEAKDVRWADAPGDVPATLPPGTAHFARFLRAGGVVSLLEWQAALAPAQRDALEAAGEIVARERAQAVARELLAELVPPVTASAGEDPLERAARAALRQTGGGV